MALRGPPSKANKPPSPSQPKSTKTNPFMDLMVANFNNASKSLTANPPMGFTENNSATYLSSGNPCLDFFFHVVPGTPRSSIERRLEPAWDFDSLTTLKLICNLRGVRGTGKSDKEGFYTAALWLHKLHPKTLACNIANIANFGYIKDLPEILYRLLEGPEVRKIQKSEWLQRCNGKKPRRGTFNKGCSFSNYRFRGPFQRQNQSKRRRGSKTSLAREIRVLNALNRNQMEKEKASAAKHGKRDSLTKKAIARYTRDPEFRFLHDRISDFFSQALKSDLDHWKSGNVTKIGLAAKWCPSLDSSYDRSTLLCESIARKVFPKESYPEYEGIEDAHYAYRVRDRLRKEVLVPLRKVLELPEVYMSANQWGLIPYNRVASVAMNLYKEWFLKHDQERFTNYLEEVKLGKSSIAAGALLPHDIIKALNDGDSDDGQVAELQWTRMVNDLKQKAKLQNCLAISDVSGSMSGEPMEVSVALGLLVSELSDEPWMGKLITFSETPKLQVVKGTSLIEKTKFIRDMEWGYNTDFQRVFDLILEVAVDGKLGGNEMVKRVIVFSDMEFDQASSNNWETDYDVIQRKFRKEGYVMPEIVFWNLRDSRATPVTTKHKGVALVSGFSKNLLKLFLDDGDLSPVATMETAISGPEYHNLVVLD